jgi:hypothetical protein
MREVWLGSWGAGLYQDDEAADLKNTIALLAKLPADGDRILEFLLEHREEPPSFDRDGGPTFWLVVADQFERRGIASAQVFNRALAVIREGADLRDQEARDMSARDLRKRAVVLSALQQRFQSPRPLRPRPSAKRPPQCPVSPGDVFSFPTMNGQGVNPWSRDKVFGLGGGVFQPNAWGALLILDTGRAYEWFPWCAYATLSVSPTLEPSLTDAREARLGMGQLGVPRTLHLHRMVARHLGRLSLDPAKVQSRVTMGDQDSTPEYAVYAGWSLYGRNLPEFYEKELTVKELLSG